MADEVLQAQDGSSLSPPSWFRRNRVGIIALASTLIFAAVVLGISRITHDVSYDAVLAALDQVSALRLAGAVLCMALSFGFLVCYDLNALRFVGARLPLVQVAPVAFSAYAIGNMAGFGPLSGGAVRFRGYGRLGLGSDRIAQVVAFVTAAFGIGLAVIGGLAVLVFAGQVAALIGQPPGLLRAAAALVLGGLALAALWLWRVRPAMLPDDATEGRGFALPSARTAGWQILITAGDLLAAATVLYLLLPADNPMPWTVFVPLFCMALGLGVLSHVPGGLGVFETIMIGGLTPVLPPEQVIGALVLYRLVYNVLPLVLAALLLAGTEFMAHRRLLGAIWAPQVSGAVIPPLMALYALVCGAMLVFSAVLPVAQDHLDWLAGTVPLPVVELAHFLSGLLGLALFVAARGLAHRLDGAFWVALAAAGLALVLTLPKAIAPYEAMALLGLVAALLLTRRCFDRPAALLAEPLTPLWLAALAVVVIAATGLLFFAYRDVDYSNSLWWQFQMSQNAPRGLRALLGIALAGFAIGLLSVLRPASRQVQAAAPEALAQAIALAQSQDDSGANLVRMGDKAVMLSQTGDAFIMFGVQGRSWISLYGPLGAQSARPELLWRFVEAARGVGARVVLYEVPADLLPACADIGLRALKLGEMAVVNLETMDYASSRWGEQRRALAKGTRDGMALQILPPEAVPAVLDDLARISDAWLGQHKAREKGFALGRFDRAYVASQPVAVLRDQGRIVAFATLMPTATRAELSIDLMRFGPDAPRGAMDFLFSALLADAKAQGYRRFNLGMAPLSGFATHAAAPMWNHFGEAIFTHGEKFYNFRGLRAFKAKFNPDWEPRYLIVGGAVSPVAALIDVTLLVGGGLKGVVGK